MPEIPLPHSHGCLVCGQDNPHGLQLRLTVDPDTGAVRTRFTPLPHHIGFTGIVHGGILATVLDETMVWAATWAGQRFCVCGELTVRFKQSAAVGQEILFTATVESFRPKLIRTTAQITSASGQLLATATGTYVPLPQPRHAAFVQTLVQDPQSAPALARFNPAAS